jgi:hypothetical protein
LVVVVVGGGGGGGGGGRLNVWILEESKRKRCYVIAHFVTIQRRHQ